MGLSTALTMLALQGAALSQGLSPLEPLVGSCWRGTLPDGGSGSELQCFTAMLGGAFVRQVNVSQSGSMTYSGETIYYRDRDTDEIRFHFYSSSGGLSSSSVVPTATGFDLPAIRYRSAEGEITARARWTRDGADAFVVVSETLEHGVWGAAFRIRLVRAGQAPVR